MPSAPTTPTGRLAPSPTGLLHVGHARSFLLAWWHARSRGGRIVLRIEDLDQERVKPGMTEATLRDLEWLGLDWDGPPIVQSHGALELDRAAESLVERGLAYPCTCSRKEILSAQSAPHAGESAGRYPGTCRGRYGSVAEAAERSGRAPALRFAAEPGPIAFDDGFAGPFAADVADDVGDFVIARSSGHVAYQLAVVVDDARAGVDEVLRGDDLLASTAQQILLQRALALSHPRWFHVPLVVDPLGRRLAKRSDDLALARLRSDGVDPRALVRWVGRSAGIETGERSTAASLVPAFRLERVPRTPVVFGPAELESLRHVR